MNLILILILLYITVNLTLWGLFGYSKNSGLAEGILVWMAFLLFGTPFTLFVLLLGWVSGLLFMYRK